MRRYIIPVIFGLAGAAVLVGLGNWQLERLAWKEAILGDIRARITAPPAALPEQPEIKTDRYLPVRLSGDIGQEALRVLVSQKQIGAGYRLISAFDTGARRVLLDRGFISVNDPIPAPPSGAVEVTGNLHWPDERLSSTPENDVAGNIWFARDLAPMAEILRTEPILVVARKMSVSEPGVEPLPLDIGGIPNDHLNYAITWYSLALVWLAMTGFFLWRMRQAEKGKTT
ncbi:surfeit locus 1 family protein [Roseovarius lutimaris]|uniref:SURF1-like protein n=1 Tax=Roseovarius lutimaris TaxID=1005928 RepID=A0A1I5C2B2_9RHOB|nr:SURF1 family protein [Roseovarius lutimaris]SFN80811.1 surfeit locus 1 family protein [Roseovarius lutimaris]